MKQPRPGAEQRFRALYQEAHDDVLRFVQRRTERDRAEDVTAEVFLTAWRRDTDRPPALGDARAWLFGIARNTLLNEARSARRRDALAVRLGAVPAPSAGEDSDLTARRLDLADAWPLLDAGEQEVIALAVFEQLTSTQAGAVLGISPLAYRLRLSRARATLRRLCAEDSSPTPFTTVQEISQ